MFGRYLDYIIEIIYLLQDGFSDCDYYCSYEYTAMDVVRIELLMDLFYQLGML